MLKLQLLALGCVAMVALGQIVFKTAADAGTAAGTFFALRPAAIAIAGFAIYGASTIVWILLLQHAPLSRVYPFVGLAFIMVPIAAHFFLGDALQVRHMVGSAIIAAGVVIAVSA